MTIHQPVARQSSLRRPGRLGIPETRALAVETCGRAAAGIAFALTAVGILAIYSSSTFWAAAKFDDPAHFLKGQLFGAALGLAAFFVCSRIPHGFWGQRSRALTLGTAVLLLAVLLVGSRYNGARRWIRFFGTGVQPSEIAKLAVIIHAAAFVAVSGERIGRFRAGFLMGLLPIAVLSGLIVVEPDLGTALLVAGLGVVVLVVGGLRLRHLLVAGVGLACAIGLMAMKYEYIRERLGFFTGAEPPYQVKQSVIAIGSGGLLGKGIGAGTGKLFFLPEVAGDFIFPAFGEEFGFVGVVFVIFLFVAFTWFGFRIARAAMDLDPFAGLLALGISCWIPLQALLNMAVVSNTLPPKGIALPFISFGSSALVVSLAAVGILVSVARAAQAAETGPPAARGGAR